MMYSAANHFCTPNRAECCSLHDTTRELETEESSLGRNVSFKKTPEWKLG